MKSGSAVANMGPSAGHDPAHALMIVYMDIIDTGWMEAYFREVLPLLTQFGATQIAGGRKIVRAEGDISVPDRIAIFRFPSLAAASAFLEDGRYKAHRENRQRGSSSQILLLESTTPADGLV